MTTSGSFSAWQAASGLTTLNEPDADPDADGLSNLLEYALGTPPLSGLQTSRFRLEPNVTSGRIDALLTRPAGDQRDLRYALEFSTDLSAWTALSMTPATSFGTDGTVTLRYADLEAASAKAQGFIRLKVMLDAGLDGTAEAVAFTAAQGFARRTFNVGRQTFAMPLQTAPVFIGRVSSVDGARITLPVAVSLADQPHYLEVLDGPLAGRVFDIDAGLRLSSTAAIAGARVAVRPHHTLSSLLPAAAFEMGDGEDTSDRALFFDPPTSSFQTRLLASDVAGDRVVAPDEGLFVQLRSKPVTLVFVGEARAQALALLPPAGGTRLLGTGLALPRAPGTLVLPTGARLRLWSGDADPAAAAYQNLLLDDASRWIDEADGADLTNQPLIEAFRAFFLVRP
jgi:hypothetical protein